jgi:NAD(P)H dehydrogenase (quinone)
MYAITGITGKVGGTLARALLADGRSVRAVVREARKASGWAALGCDVAIADLEDEARLTAVFTGAEAVLSHHRSLILNLATPKRRE